MTLIQDNKNLPLISVIIPAYNAERFIDETIQSVLAQDYPNFEVIIVNDGSSDQTLNIIKKYEQAITLIDIENSGVSYARNIGVRAANGDWLSFIDADDLWDVNKLSRQFTQLGDRLWSHCNSYYIGEGQSGDVTRADLSKQFEGQIFEKLVSENFITTSTVLINKTLFLEAGGFDENFSALEDWKLWLDVSINNPIAYLNAPVVKYRVYQGSTSRKARQMLPLHLAVIEHAFQQSKYDDQQLKKLAIIKSFNICSYLAEDSADYTFSAKCAFSAMWRSGFSLATSKRMIRTMMNLIAKLN